MNVPRTGLGLALLVVALLALPPPIAGAEGNAACAEPGSWIGPRDRRPIASPIAGVAPGSIVLLGEEHDSAEQHRWQLQVLAALHARHPNLVIGFEAFPRRVQPTLDRWVAGKLDADAFLLAVDWRRYWGFDAGLYLPLFDFARMNRIPMVALNVGNELSSRIGRLGLAAIPEELREGVPPPAPPAEAYRAELERVGRQHGDATNVGRFVDAQLFWDRAFATALAAARDRPERPLVVGIVGAGHVGHGYGVPHQLRSAGIADVTTWLTWDAGERCEELDADLADAVFVIDAPRQKPPPPTLRLGVRLEAVEGGVRVATVAAGSVGADAGLRPGDILVTAAGKTLSGPDDVVAALARQAPGTWLPMVARRDGESIDLVAKFAANP